MSYKSEVTNVAKDMGKMRCIKSDIRLLLLMEDFGHFGDVTFRKYTSNDKHKYYLQIVT